MLEFDSGVIGGELPIGFAVFTVSIGLPGDDSLIGSQAKRPDPERFSVTVMNDVGESRGEGTEGRCQSKLA